MGSSRRAWRAEGAGVWPREGATSRRGPCPPGRRPEVRCGNQGRSREQRGELGSSLRRGGRRPVGVVGTPPPQRAAPVPEALHKGGRGRVRLAGGRSTCVPTGWTRTHVGGGEAGWSWSGAVFPLPRNARVPARGQGGAGGQHRRLRGVPRGAQRGRLAGPAPPGPAPARAASARSPQAPGSFPSCASWVVLHTQATPRGAGLCPCQVLLYHRFPSRELRPRCDTSMPRPGARVRPSRWARRASHMLLRALLGLRARPCFVSPYLSLCWFFFFFKLGFFHCCETRFLRKVKRKVETTTVGA